MCQKALQKRNASQLIVRCEALCRFAHLSESMTALRRRVLWDPPYAAVLKSGETDDRPWLGSKLNETPLRVSVAKTDPRRRIVRADI